LRETLNLYLQEIQTPPNWANIGDNDRIEGSNGRGVESKQLEQVQQ
jgi:hypothetical protein